MKKKGPFWIESVRTSSVQRQSAGLKKKGALCHVRSISQLYITNPVLFFYFIFFPVLQPSSQIVNLSFFHFFFFQLKVFPTFRLTGCFSCFLTPDLRHIPPGGKRAFNLKVCRCMDLPGTDSGLVKCAPPTFVIKSKTRYYGAFPTKLMLSKAFPTTSPN